MDDDSAKIVRSSITGRKSGGGGGLGGGGGKKGYDAVLAAALMMKGNYNNLNRKSWQIHLICLFKGTLMAAGLGALALLAGKCIISYKARLAFF